MVDKKHCKSVKLPWHHNIWLLPFSIPFLSLFHKHVKFHWLSVSNGLKVYSFFCQHKSVHEVYMFVTESDLVLWGEVLYVGGTCVHSKSVYTEQQVYKAICFVFKASVYTEQQVYKIICFCVRKSSSLCCISLSINHWKHRTNNEAEKTHAAMIIWRRICFPVDNEIWHSNDHMMTKQTNVPRRPSFYQRQQVLQGILYLAFSKVNLYTVQTA